MTQRRTEKAGESLIVGSDPLMIEWRRSARKMPWVSQEKVRLNLSNIFPQDTYRALNGSELSIESVQRVPGPISTQI